jgi:hypothetical protein
MILVVREVDGSKEINIIWGIQVTIFNNGPWVSTNHPVRQAE